MLAAFVFLGLSAEQTMTSGGVASASGSAPSVCPVLVAKKLIRKGTAGSVIAKKRMYLRMTVPCGEREDGAISDPARLNGRVARWNIFPGQQLTRADFRLLRRHSSSR
jgi:hypothetical protein